MPGYDISTWYGLWAPAGTPSGIERPGALAAELRAFNASEAAKRARIVKDWGATLD